MVMSQQADQRRRFRSQGRRLAEEFDTKGSFTSEPLSGHAIATVFISKLPHVVFG
jgi:hypothetical protein